MNIHIALVIEFLEYIWNTDHRDRIDQYIHPEFKYKNEGKEVFLQQLNVFSEAFDHRTVIEDIIYDHDVCIAKAQLSGTHIGTWNNIPATGVGVAVNVYHYFRIIDKKIKEYRVLINDELIEEQLREESEVNISTTRYKRA